MIPTISLGEFPPAMYLCTLFSLVGGLKASPWRKYLQLSVLSIEFEVSYSTRIASEKKKTLNLSSDVISVV